MLYYNTVNKMRIDKFLKNARIIKRRSIANTACAGGHVLIGDKVAKPGSEVKPGDILTITFGERRNKYQVLDVKDVVKKEESAALYRQIDD